MSHLGAPWGRGHFCWEVHCCAPWPMTMPCVWLCQSVLEGGAKGLPWVPHTGVLSGVVSGKRQRGHLGRWGDRAAGASQEQSGGQRRWVLSTQIPHRGNSQALIHGKTLGSSAMGRQRARGEQGGGPQVWSLVKGLSRPNTGTRPLTPIIGAGAVHGHGDCAGGGRSGWGAEKTTREAFFRK